MTTFVTPPGSDTAGMAKYGLGGMAVVGDLVFAGGMALDLATLKRLPGADTVADETRMCFDEIAEGLAATGRALSDIAKITCYVSDDVHRPELWRTLKEIFAPGPYPKYVTLEAGIAADCRVEFEVMAVRPGAKSETASTKEFIRSSPLGVSAGAVTDRLVFASGLAIDASTMRRVPEAATIKDEVRVCLQRIEGTLREAGLTLKDLAKVTCWVSEEAHRMEFVYAYRDLLAPGPYPSRATFSIGLAGDCRVQIDALAARPEVG
ncbi:MAG: RidA family protein [Spirillospora sp.]